MRHLLHYLLLTVILAAVVFLLVVPQQAAIYHNPLSVIGLALIGIGLCKRTRQRTSNV